MPLLPSNASLDRRPLRVGFLIDRWDPSRGGAEGACADLARHLVRRGHDVRAFARAHAPGAPGVAQRVRAAGWTSARFERALATSLVAAAERERCDVTIGVRHLARVDLYWPHGGGHRASLRAKHAARGAGGLGGRASREPSARQRVFLDLEAELLARGGARRIACVSELVRAELSAEHPACEPRLVDVPNGVDRERFRPALRELPAARALRAELGVTPGVPLLLLLARRPQLKGLPELLRALAGVSAGWHLLVAGPKDAVRWRRRVAAAGLDRRVTVRAEVAPEVAFGAADLLVAPTRRDPCSLAVLEALAAGIPVLTTPASGAAEAFGAEPEAGAVVGSADELDAWRTALGAWIAKAASGAVDRERVRACTRDYGRVAWLERLEGLVLELGAR